MTEQQAIKRLKSEMEWESIELNREAFSMGIKALKEIQQYRAIGTVEDIYNMLEVLNRTISELHSEVSKYRELGTVEELQALKEKNTPYKPQEYEDKYYACKCGNILLFKWRKYPTELIMPKIEGLPYCMVCGQKLDWE